MNLLRLAFALLAFLLLPVGVASAHQTSLSYVNVRDTGGKLSAEIKASFLDLELAVGVDEDFDGKITWRETKSRLDAISAYVQSRTELTAGGACALTRNAAKPIEQGGEGYLSLGFAVACPKAEAVSVASSMFLDIDPTSRVLVSSHTAGGDQTYVVGLSNESAAARAKESNSNEVSIVSFILQGIEHLFGGPDHMLFLLVLIIPALGAGQGFRHVAIAALLPITGFTLGHALTLTSAASGLLRPPPQLVESLIALTILLTSIDNIRPFIPGPRSGIAFVFGLVHGFGFASALGALDLSGWSMAIALLGFNLGIEAGQAVLALAVAPALYLVRKPAKRLHIMPLGISLVSAGIATFWLIQRVFFS